MFVVEELIRAEENGALSFGNHIAGTKQKVRDFEVSGDVYNLKTYSEMTKLEKNECLLFESVPGATVQNLVMGENEIKLTLYGVENTQIIFELEPSCKYNIEVGGSMLGEVKTTMSGKLVFSAELSQTPVDVVITKI